MTQAVHSFLQQAEKCFLASQPWDHKVGKEILL